jgi:hypothetical protein
MSLGAMDLARAWEYIAVTLGIQHEENDMRYRFLWGCGLFAFAVAVTPAQTKLSTSGKCNKPEVQQSVPAGDQEGHVFMLGQGKCVTEGKVAGASSKEGAFSEHAEATGNHLKTWGVYVETFDSGDKIHYNYQGTATMKDGKLQSGLDKWQITGGTGKMKGLKGSGTCKLSPGTNEGGLDYSCTGTYMQGGAAPAAKPQ